MHLEIPRARETLLGLQAGLPGCRAARWGYTRYFQDDRRGEDGEDAEGGAGEWLFLGIIKRQSGKQGFAPEEPLFFSEADTAPPRA